MKTTHDLVLFIRQLLKDSLMEDFRYQYNRSTFNPPADVIGTAKRAIEVVNKTKLVGHGGNEGSGMQKSKALASGEGLNHEQLKRMKAFFDKNTLKVKQEKISGGNIYNSELIQKWELWGGDAGMRWVNQQIHSTQETNKDSKKIRPKGMSKLMNTSFPANQTHHSNNFYTEAATLGQDGLNNFYPELNPFESIVRKWVHIGDVWKESYEDEYTYRFPAQAVDDLKEMGITNLEPRKVTNPRHINFNEVFYYVKVNPKDWDYI